MSSRVLPEVSISRKLYASKEDIIRSKVLATSMSTEMFGKKVYIPFPSLLLKMISMVLPLPRKQAFKMTFHHKTTKAREIFKMTLTYLKKNPKLRSSGFPRILLALPQQVPPQLQGFPSIWCGFPRGRTRSS